jgi:hypothetical protein
VLPICFFGGFSGLGSISRALDRGTVTGTDAVLLASKTVCAGVGYSSLLALLLYLTLSHRVASRFAAGLQVSVEGPFLHIRQHMHILTDRKLHFRSIVDYATTQDFLMRYFSIHALQMTTTAGGPSSTITIPGVKDCLRIRDIRSDIDRLRENQ